MSNLPKWKILKEGGFTVMRFSLAGAKICDVLSDGVNNKNVKMHTDIIDFDMMEIIIQIANDKLDVAIP